MRMRFWRIRLILCIVTSVGCLFLAHQPRALSIGDDQYEEFHKERRINAHGDEFMSLALSTDEKRLAVGTEKGEVIIWSNTDHRVETRLLQGSPVHSVSFLGDNRHVIAAGGPHTGDAKGCVIRKWDVESGKFEEFKGCGSDTILYLDTDNKSGLIAASTVLGAISIWDGVTGKMVASWKIGQATSGMTFTNNRIYAAQVDLNVVMEKSEEEPLPSQIVVLSADSPKDQAHAIYTAKPGMVISTLDSSPDGKYLATSSYDENKGHQVLLLDAVSGAEKATFAADLATFVGNTKMLLFVDDEPAQWVQIESDGNTKALDFDERAGFHQSGMPRRMMGWAASSDMKKAWAVFQLNGSLLEYDLEKKKATGLIVSHSLPYTMDTLEMANGMGWLVTGGDDKFIRVWTLKDLSLKKEFQVANGVPQSVALLDDGDQIVFSSSSKDPPTDIFVGSIATGEVRKLMSIPKPFVIVIAAGRDILYSLDNKIVLASVISGTTIREFKVDEQVSLFSVSANGNWLAVADTKGTLSLFNVLTGESKAWAGAKVDSPSNIAVTSNGQFIYTTEWRANLRRWDTLKQTSADLGTIRGQAHCLRLSVDEKSVVIGGNHRDIGIYDGVSGERIFYSQTEASDFYVTNCWLHGTRLIFTTDAGVMFDGNLER